MSDDELNELDQHQHPAWTVDGVTYTDPTEALEAVRARRAVAAMSGPIRFAIHQAVDGVLDAHDGDRLYSGENDVLAQGVASAVLRAIWNHRGELLPVLAPQDVPWAQVWDLARRAFSGVVSPPDGVDQVAVLHADGGRLAIWNRDKRDGGRVWVRADLPATPVRRWKYFQRDLWWPTDPSRQGP